MECKVKEESAKKGDSAGINGTKVECKGAIVSCVTHTYHRINGTKVECKASKSTT